MTTEIRKVDYDNEMETQQLCELLNVYAQDPMGGGKAIEPETLDNLAKKIGQFPTAFSLIAYVDDQPAALTNCFFGFSTFAARPLINIHDLVVHPDFRGRGLCNQLLESVEKVAADNDCCKITLEVLDKNEIAMNAYRKFGFDGYELDPETGRALFWQKKLSSS